jgi:hypothetical protein
MLMCRPKLTVFHRFLFDLAILPIHDPPILNADNGDCVMPQVLKESVITAEKDESERWPGTDKAMKESMAGSKVKPKPSGWY